MRFSIAKNIEVLIPAKTVEAISAECERHPTHETGGRIVGVYSESKGRLQIRVRGLIDAGPDASRSSTSLHQDGDYQVRVFRAIEQDEPDIEHLGTWHSHHCNGLPHLSAGDIETYRRTVNHEKHNLDFWHAILVTERVGKLDYTVKHYVLRRGRREVWEVPSSSVTVIDESPIWGPDHVLGKDEEKTEERSSSSLGDAAAIMASLFPKLKTYSSRGQVYWKGYIELPSEARAQVVVLERDENLYAARGATHDVSVEAETPWEAAVELERTLARASWKER